MSFFSLPKFRHHAIVVLAGFALLASASAASVSVSHRVPCNLFPVGEPVRFEATLRGLPEGESEVTGTVINYFGEEVWTDRQKVNGKTATLQLEPGKLETGYYELKVKAVSRTPEGRERVTENGLTSFGVAHFVHRTAKEAREAGARYGLKIFQLGKPGVWWRKGEDWKLAEAVEASARLGFQWTRHQFNQGPDPEPGIISTIDLATKHPMNIVLKIEGFPESCYDADRYGPLAAWIEKKKAWNRMTVPKKEPYQAWLKAEIAKLPPDQDVFEVGNEVWDKMSGKEFAEWVGMVVEAVRAVRPKAKVGIDIGDRDWQREVVAAGGLEAADYLVSHPYAFSVLPERKTRIVFRNDADYTREKAGRPFDVYVTEYGWSTAPEDTKRRHGVSERVQAQRTARQSLMLYAEDIKVMIAHWMADREQDRTDREHWFGFFRLTEEPKPVAMAQATSARIIDGGKFIGDLWYGPGVGALLFEKGGIDTLAMWTIDETPGAARKITVQTGAEKVNVIDIMGRERATASPGGKVELNINADVTYIQGVGKSVVAQATGPKENLNPDVWGNRGEKITATRLATPPKIDGDLTDLDPKAASNPLRNPKVPAGDASGEFWITWDEATLYVAARIHDDALFHETVTRAKGKTADVADLLQIGIGTRPDRQPEMNTKLYYDYTLRVSPTWADGKPRLSIHNLLWDQPVENPGEDDPSGVRWAAVRTADGWAVEIAVPTRLLKLAALKEGDKLSMAAELRDTDKAGDQPVRLVFGGSTPQDWPYLILKGSGSPDTGR